MLFHDDMLNFVGPSHQSQKKKNSTTNSVTFMREENNFVEKLFTDNILAHDDITFLCELSLIIQRVSSLLSWIMEIQ